MDRLTLFEVGGGVQHPPSENQLKMASKYPKKLWLFLFLYDLSEKQKNGFLVILGV